ncbi:MAG TPA: acyl carrier protein [Mycobacteriales bacterium]|nr:acyl carrier protein [Mycobacteriales bacterium]
MSAQVTAAEAKDWLVEKLAVRLGVEQSEIDPNQYFDEFDLDSTEALILAGELESWLGFELEATALWYHPTIAALSEHIAEEHARHAAAA